MDNIVINIINFLSAIIWPIARLSGVFLVAPWISSQLIPNRIKIVFLFSLAFLCSFKVHAQISLLNFHLSYILLMGQEILIGVLMGFCLSIIFEVFIMVGQFISMQAGLGFATMVAPDSNATVPLLGQLYLMMATLLFLNLDGHLAFLDLVMNSFTIMPAVKSGFILIDLDKVLHFTMWMFQKSLLVALPAVIALFLVNLSFGIIARVAPQLNLFSMGLPITIMVAFLMMWLSFPAIVEQVDGSLNQGFLVIKGLLH